MRARSESPPPASAQRGSSDAPTLDPRRRVRILARRDVDAACARRFISAMTVSLCPQTSAPSALM